MIIAFYIVVKMMSKLQDIIDFLIGKKQKGKKEENNKNTMKQD